MSFELPESHTAVVTTIRKGPLSTISVPTPRPAENEVVILNRWTASTPLDLHQNDGHLLVNPPQVLGDGIAGPIVALGSSIPQIPHFDPDGSPRPLQVGEWVFGFGWREQKEKGFQDFVTAPNYILGRLPKNVTPQEAITLPNNLVTAFNTITANLGLEAPWPKPKGWTPKQKDDVILVWGGASSAGMYVVQVLKWYGYVNVVATASAQHHELLKELGGREVIDYRDEDAVPTVLRAARGLNGGRGGPAVAYVIDNIGSISGTLTPLSQIAEKGTRVAVLLPVIIRDSDPKSDELPEYSFDVAGVVPWADGVVAEGVRTHFYLDNPLWKEKLQSEIVPTLLRDGVVKPNRQRIVEEATLLDRAESAMSLLRGRELRGERAVWRVSDLPETEFEKRS